MGNYSIKKHSATDQQAAVFDVLEVRAGCKNICFVFVLQFLLHLHHCSAWTVSEGNRAPISAATDDSNQYFLCFYF